MEERDKMLQGKIYDCNEPELLMLRKKAHALCLQYNQLTEDDPKRAEILKELIPDCRDFYFQGPIYFDYGVFTHIGRGSYANFNLTILDVCPVNIGDNVYMGANVSLLSPMHPLIPEERNMYMSDKGYMTDREYGKPITIKDDCWIASNVVVVGGVTIGKGCVIGAGSVVTRDIPDNTLAYGNPCRPIRKITAEDSIYLKKDLF